MAGGTVDDTGRPIEWLVPFAFAVCMGWVIWHMPAYILDFIPPESESLYAQIKALHETKEVAPGWPGLFGGLTDAIDWLALVLIPILFVWGMLTVRCAPMEFEDWRPWDRFAIFIGRVTLPYSSLRDYPSLRLLPDVILFLTGPAVFFFIRTLLHRGLPSGRRYWRHFIPAFIHVFIINTIVALHAEGLVDFLTRRQIIVLFYFVEVAAMFHLLAYLIGSVRFFRTYRREFYEKYAAEFIGEALLPHCIASLVILGLWIGGAFYGLVTSQPSYISYVLVWFALVFSVYFLAFRILLSTELLDLPPLLITSPSPSLAVPPETSAPPSQELDELDQYMLKHKPFLHPEIKIGDLAGNAEWK